MVMFVRVASKVPVKFPKPGEVVGGTSCEPVKTAPKVCADAGRASRAKTQTKARATELRCIFPPVFVLQTGGLQKVIPSVVEGPGCVAARRATSPAQVPRLRSG